MSPQETAHVSRIKVTPISGKETLGTWWCHWQRGGRTQSRGKPTHEMVRSCEQTIRVGAYAYQRLNLVAKGKAHRRDAKTSNRTWEIRPSGIIGGPRKTWLWRNCEPTSPTERVRMVTLCLKQTRPSSIPITIAESAAHRPRRQQAGSNPLDFITMSAPSTTE